MYLPQGYGALDPASILTNTETQATQNTGLAGLFAVGIFALMGWLVFRK
jgi:hypothetical protein